MVTGTYKALTLEADTATHWGHDIGILDRANITLHASVYGIANNAIQLGKWAGVVDDNTAEWDLVDEFNKTGDRDLAMAYGRSRAGYDLAGDLVGSLLPGALAIKGISLLKAGKSAHKWIGWFDGRANKTREAIQTAYAKSGSAADVTSLKWKLAGNTFGQQFVEGAIITGAIEATLNYGEILNNEGLTATEKLSHIGGNLLLGGVIQGGIGGFFDYRKLSGLTEVALRDAQKVENEYVYQSLSTRVGNVPTKTEAAHKLLHTIGQYDRISAMPAEGSLRTNARLTNLDLAQSDMNLAVSNMFPSSDKSEYARVMRDFLDVSIKSPEGRLSIANELSALKKFEYSQIDVFDQGKLLDNMLEDVELLKTSRKTIEDVRNNTGRGVWDAEDLLVREEFGGGKKLYVADDLPEDLATRQAVAAHASVFKIAPNKLKVFEDELDKFTVANNLPATTTLHTALETFYKYAGKGGSDPAKKWPALNEYLEGIGEDTAMAVYGRVSKSYLDSATKTITDKPIKHIGDLKDFSFHEPTGTVLLGATAKARRTVTLADVPKIAETTDLHDYQAMRLIASSTTAPMPTKALDKLSLAELYKVESMLYKVEPGKKVMIGKLPYERSEVVDRIAKAKGAEYDRLIAALPEESVENIHNSLGYVDNGKTGGIMLASKEGIKATPEADIIQRASSLSSKRTITIVHDKPLMNANGLSAAVIAESVRAADIGIMQVAGGKILGHTSATDLKHMPTALNIEFPAGLQSDRMLAATPTIGHYGSLVQQASRLGSWLVRTADDVFASRIMTPIKEAGTSLAASKQGSAEFAAFREWFYGVDAKYVHVGDGLVVEKSLAAQIKTDLAMGKNPDELLRGLQRGKDYNRLDSPEAKHYANTFWGLNREYIANKKLIATEAWGNTSSLDLEAIYFPPRNAPFETFIVEQASSPLDQMSERMYRVVANNKDELEQKVLAALSHAETNKLQWSRRDSASINEYQKARGKFEWSDDLEGGYANSAMRKLGATASLTPETDIHKILLEDAEWFKRANMQVHRAGMELTYADDISKLNTLSRLENAQMKSDLAGRDKLPMGAYDQVMHTMLGSDAHGYSVWQHMNNTLEDWSANMLTKVNQSIQNVRGRKDKIAAIEEESKAVADELQKMGINVPMADAVTERLARETSIAPKDIRNAVSFLNHLQATMLLRLDLTDAGMNVLGHMVKTSTEMQYLKSIRANMTPEGAAAFDAEAKALFGLMDEKVGENILTHKHVAKVYKDVTSWMFTEKGAARVTELTNRRLLVSNEKALVDMYQEMRIHPDTFKDPAAVAAWKTKSMKALHKGLEYGSKPSDWSATLNQLVSLEIAERLGKAAGMSADKLDNFMFSFSGRTNAIYDSFQKPRLFQGAAGIAMSLYQGYMFHMMANIFRYADNGVKSAPAMMLAMNSTFFGATSLPGYQFINENIVGQNTKGNVDINTAMSTALGASQGRDLADFVMYGAGAFLLQGNMHTRGGMTPRSPILIPSSMSEVPLVNALSKTIGSVMESGHQIMYGAPIVSSLWDGLLNTGLNRPLVGLGTVLRGQSVDNNYNTVMYHEDMFSLTSALRLTGMKPLNEQVGRDLQARQMHYKAHNAELKKGLGEEIRILKDKNPESFNDPGLMKRLGYRYFKAGGDAKNFDDFLADQLAKGQDDLYTRLEKTAVRQSDQLSNFRDIFGGY